LFHSTEHILRLPVFSALCKLPFVNAAEILNTLRELTDRKEIEFLPFAKDLERLPKWQPAARYIQVLGEGTKPETASEDLFTALFRELLKIEPSRQITVRDGWVDFRVREPNARPIPFELKALFKRDTPDTLRRYDANPDHYKDQIKNYLSEHEYLVLTDLRTAWLCSARDYFFEDRPFAVVPFADFLQRCIDCRSIADALRRFEDTTDKPELEQQFFEDLKNWYGEFDKIHWQSKNQAAEFIILLINKLIFAKTLEDFGLVSYKFIQNEFALQKDRWEAKGAAKVTHCFLKNFEDFFDEYYDTEIFEERIWDKLVPDDANFDRFCKKLEFVLGLDPWNTAMGRGIVNYNYRRIDEDIFGKSYEMFLPANRKDEGIYYTPASITGPMADSLVNSLAAKIVDEISAAVSHQKCDFAQAEKLMAQLAEIRVADTACGSGGFLIKVLRAFWRQYKHINDACAWVHKILKPDNGEMFLAELPPNVEAALAFRRRWNFDNKRKLMTFVAEHHISTVISDPIARSVIMLMFCRAIIPLCASELNFRKLTGTSRAFPNSDIIFGKTKVVKNCRGKRFPSGRCSATFLDRKH
jgi:N-6 DNA Methylase